jgi:hypothetical protein
MTDIPNRYQLDKDVAQLRKDLKKLGEEIDMIGKRGKLGKSMTSDDLSALLIKEPFILSHPPKEHFEIGEIEDLVNRRTAKDASSAK